MVFSVLKDEFLLAENQELTLVEFIMIIMDHLITW